MEDQIIEYINKVEKTTSRKIVILLMV